MNCGGRPSKRFGGLVRGSIGKLRDPSFDVPEVAHFFDHSRDRIQFFIKPDFNFSPRGAEKFLLQMNLDEQILPSLLRV